MKPGKYSICNSCCGVTKGSQSCCCGDDPTADYKQIVMDNIYYNVGDEVVILDYAFISSAIPDSDLYFDELDPVFAEDMQRYAGQQAVIRKVTMSGYLLLQILGEPDNLCDYYWSPFWLRPESPPEEIVFKQCLEDDLFEL